jgi:IS4 transposase
MMVYHKRAKSPIHAEPRQMHLIGAHFLSRQWGVPQLMHLNAGFLNRNFKTYFVGCAKVSIEERTLPKKRSVLKDEVILFTGTGAAEKCPCPYPMRRIEFYDTEKDEILVFLTNNLKLSATTIAAIYKDRWQIELFFKALKQNLKIKTFVGTTPNAVKIQIWTALIAMLILRYLQIKSTFNWSLSNLVAIMRMNLFTYRDLWTWLNEPFETPPAPYAQEQLKLALA